MIAIASSQMPADAVSDLGRVAQVLWLEPQPQLYKGIESHPDIFFCQKDTLFVASPDIPPPWVEWLTKAGVKIIFGESRLGSAYPLTAHYNAVFASGMLIHHRNVTDKKLKLLCQGAEEVHVKQAYTRCNLFHLGQNHFITSDKDIQQQLSMRGMNLIFVDPRQIRLDGHPYGFIGGCFGKSGNQIFCCGRLDSLKEAAAIRLMIQQLGLKLVELGNGHITDVGSIFFFDVG